VSRSGAQSSSELVRILFVPGDLLDSERAGTLLARSMLEVQEAASFAHAWVLAAQSPLALIVLRSKLGGESASEFCRRVRVEWGARAPKLLMITDLVDDLPSDDADLACDAHLVSPVRGPQLLSTIAELLDLQERRHARAPLDVLVHTEGFAHDDVAVDATLSTGITLSEEGMLIEASRQLGIGTRGCLQFFLPEQSIRLTVEARVRVAVNEMRLLYMIEFVDLAPQHRALIRRYIGSQREAA
jgi:DNA-binding response OmpR family regulator